MSLPSGTIDSSRRHLSELGQRLNEEGWRSRTGGEEQEAFEHGSTRPGAARGPTSYKSTTATDHEPSRDWIDGGRRRRRRC